MKNKKNQWTVPNSILGLHIALLALITFVLYYPSLNHPLIYDSLSLRDSHFFKDSFSSFSFFADRIWGHLSFAMINEAWPENLKAQRFFNIVLQTLNGILLYQFLKTTAQWFLTLKKKSNQLHIQWLCFFASLIFICHPVGVYATAFLIQRYLLLALCFALISALFFIKAWQKSSPLYFVFSAISFYFCLYSKENAIFYPVLFFSLVILKESFSKSKKNLLLPAGLFGFCLLTALWNHFHQVGLVHEIHGPFVSKALPTSSLWGLSLINQASLFFKYLFMDFLPYPGWISIYRPSPFPSSLNQPLLWIGSLAFLIYPIAVYWQIFIKQKKTLLTLALLAPWILFFTEFVPIRHSESFAFYRSYLWIPFLFLGCFSLRHFPPKKLYGTSVVIAIVFFLISLNRIHSLESPLSAWQDAADKLPKKAQNIPGAYRIYADLGYAQLQANQSDKALASYKKSIELRPDYPSAHNSAGAILLNAGHIDEAITHFEKATSLDSSYLSAHLNLGVAYGQKNELKKAISALQKVIQIDPKNITATSKLGDIYYRLKIYPKAQEYFKAVLKLDPKNAIAYHNLGQIFFDTKNYSPAEKMFKASIQHHPQLINAHYNLGILYLGQKKYDASLKAFAQVVRINPNMEKAIYNMGVVSIQQKKLDQAERFFRHVLKLNPDSKSAQQALKAVLSEKNKPSS